MMLRYFQFLGYLFGPYRSGNGLITDDRGRGILQGPASYWVEELTRFAVELGVDTFVFCPVEDQLGQLERFAAEVVPSVREAVARERRH